MRPRGWHLQVHIADVAHYVRTRNALDQEARLRGTSVYFPDRAVPMLPLELSTDICSLRPQVDRLVMSCVMEIDHHGEIVGYELSPGIIRSAERMTYTAVNAVLEGDAVAKNFAPGNTRKLSLDDVGRLTLSITKVRPFIVTSDWRPTLLTDRTDLRRLIVPTQQQLELFAG